MIGIKILVPNGIDVTTPQGVVTFPPNTWVELKPKWSFNPDLDYFASNAKALGVKIIDQNEDMWDCALLEQDEADTLARKCFSYMMRFV